MRLLFADFDLPYLMRDDEHPVGGWSVQLLAWVRALKAAGHTAGVLTWRGANAHVGAQDLCELLETYDPTKGVRVAKYVYSYIPSMLSAARSFRPDVVVQASAGVQTGMMAWVAQRLDVPFVHRVASDADADDRYKAKLSKIERVAFEYGLERAAAIVCQNGYQLRSLAARYPQTPMSVIHNPFFAPSAMRDILPRSRRRYVAWLGLFKKPKDLPLLVRIAGAHPGVTFRIAGGPAVNVDPATTRALAELRGLPNVEMAGYVLRANVSDFLANAVALLCTSSYEGFSNAFLEAFAVGTPVLARHAVDPDLIVTKNSLGLTAADGDGLLSAVGQLQAMGDDQYRALAGRCRNYVVAHHSGKTRVDALISAVAPLVSARRAA